MKEQPQPFDLEKFEMRILLDAVFERYGYDFRNYATASLRRRVQACVEAERLASITGLAERLLHDAACMERFLRMMTVNVTSMFRDPAFFRVFREKAVARLRTYPFIRLWHAGCSSGEEVYSMAILLEEEGLLPRCRIYATDLSETVLAEAKKGVFPLSVMKEYTRNYQESGGQRDFSDYYSADHGNAIFSQSLRDSIVFAQHNLVTDGSFNSFHAVLCRNVMIYFDRSLQDRVHGLLYNSLEMFGILAIGIKESMRFTPDEPGYESLDEENRLYRKVR